MAKYLVGGDRYADELVEASSIVEAVREYSDTADGSDRFDVYARAESDDHWTVFPVTTRTELIITVGNGKRGPMVDDDDSEARMTTPHTPPDDALAAIEARAAAATTLPWVVDDAPGLCGHDVDRYHVIAAPEAAVDVVALVPRVEGADADVALIVAAVNGLPTLLAALRAERAQHAADVAAAVAAEREACAAACRDVASDAADDDPVSETADACAEAIDARAVRS